MHNSSGEQRDPRAKKKKKKPLVKKTGGAASCRKATSATTQNATGPARSGTGPAAKPLKKSRSGTSGMFSESGVTKKATTIGSTSSKSIAGITTATGSKKEVHNKSLPDVPDRPRKCRTPVEHLPDDIGMEPPVVGSGFGGSRNSNKKRGLENESEFDPEGQAWTVSGAAKIGRINQPRAEFDVYENPDLRWLLQLAGLPCDTVVEAADEAEISVIDIDTHHWKEAPTHEVLHAHLAAIDPQPDAAWISHRSGLKLVFIGPQHEDRALAAAFSVPKCFQVEMLRHTRHPRAASSNHPGAACGPVQFAATPAVTIDSVFTAIGPPTDAQREYALAELGMSLGERYNHDRCPIDPGADSDATDCVMVLERGLYCHRCASHGHRLRAGLAPGFAPYNFGAIAATTELDRLVQERVHWTHARLVLIHRFPHLSEDLLELAFRKSLEQRYGIEDPRIALVFNSDLDFFRGDGVWLARSTFEITKVDNDAADCMPYVQFVSPGKNDELVIGIDRPRRAQIKYREPAGYTPIVPYIGISFAPVSGTIPVCMPPLPAHAIELLADPMALDEAFARLELAFPRIDRRYFQACLAAMICADARLGQPPMVVCSGPSGSGKEQTPRLVASIVGQDIYKAEMNDDEEAFMRGLGVALTAGKKFIVFDEITKTAKLAMKLKGLLQISTHIQWRDLYGSRRITTPFRAAVIFPCTYFPDLLVKSEEFNRRVRHVHLHRRVPDWSQTSGGDTCAWRDRTAENAFIANSILTHMWRLCHG